MNFNHWWKYNTQWHIYKRNVQKFSKKKYNHRWYFLFFTPYFKNCAKMIITLCCIQSNNLVIFQVNSWKRSISWKSFVQRYTLVLVPIKSWICARVKSCKTSSTILLKFIFQSFMTTPIYQAKSKTKKNFTAPWIITSVNIYVFFATAKC